MAQSRLEKVGTIYSRMRGLLATGAVKPEQVCTRFCGSDPVGSGTLYWSDPELLILESGTPCIVRIWNSLYWSDLERLVPVGSNALYWSDPELHVLVGSGTPCTSRIRNSMYWSDPELLELVGSRSLCAGWFKKNYPGSRTWWAFYYDCIRSALA